MNETREFLERNGVVLASFSRQDTQRSDTVIIAKNLPATLDERELKGRFEKYGVVKRFLLPPGELRGSCVLRACLCRVQDHCPD